MPGIYRENAQGRRRTEAKRDSSHKTARAGAAVPRSACRRRPAAVSVQGALRVRASGAAVRPYEVEVGNRGLREPEPKMAGRHTAVCTSSGE